MSHRPVCVKCALEMRPEKNDVRVEDMDGPLGFRLYSADLWKCEGCGTQVIAGFGSGPIVNAFQPGYAAERATAQPKYLFQSWATIYDRDDARAVKA